MDTFSGKCIHLSLIFLSLCGLYHFSKNNLRIRLIWISYMTRHISHAVHVFTFYSVNIWLKWSLGTQINGRSWMTWNRLEVVVTSFLTQTQKCKQLLKFLDKIHSFIRMIIGNHAEINSSNTWINITKRENKVVNSLQKIIDF